MGDAIKLCLHKFSELSVKRVRPLVKDTPNLMKFIPNFEDDELFGRQFFWTILASLKLQAVRQLINGIKELLKLAENERKDNLVETHPDVLNIIQDSALQISKVKVIQFI